MQLMDKIISLGAYLPWVGLLMAVLVAAALLVKASLALLDMRRLLKQKAVFLEIIPPVQSDKTPHATQQFYASLHGLRAAQHWRDKLLRRKVTLSLELPSKKEDGIRFVARVPETELTTFKQKVRSYSKDVRFQEVADYLPDNLDYRHASVLDFGQTGHFALPLSIEEKSLEQTDPIPYVTGAMAQPVSGELIAFQLVISPTRVAGATAIGRRVLKDPAALDQLASGGGSIGRRLLRAINTLLFAILDLMHDTPSTPTKSSYTPPAQDSEHGQLGQAVYRKTSQDLFKVSVRALVIGPDKHSEKERIGSMKSSLTTYNVPDHQSLKARHNFPAWLKGRYRLYLFKHRLLPLFSGNACTLGVSELADLYHFPYGDTTKTENLAKSLTKTLAAPVTLKRGTEFSVVIGRNDHHGQLTDIGMAASERARHMYIIGATGTGKTTMLRSAMIQDIQNGNGIAFIDPHGDAAEELLGYIPEERLQDVVYFNPYDLDYNIGLNLLELPKTSTQNDYFMERDRVTESIVSLFRKIFSDDDEGGHRIEDVLRNTVHTAMTVEGATIFTVLKLLRNTAYRKKVVAALEDQDLKDFWYEELGKAGSFQRVKMSAGVVSKLSRFQRTEATRRILEQVKSTINFDDIMNSGKILICNFSKDLGEDTSELFGIAVLAHLQMAAYRRRRIKPADRRPFYVYVDEFQNFATESFVQLLSEARKYKLFLVMAEQTTAQQDSDMVETIFANVGTVVCFHTASLSDERFVLPLLEPAIKKGELANLPAYHFYVRLMGADPQEPLSGKTIVPDKGSDEIAERVIEASRQNYTTPYDSNAPSEPPEAPGTDDEPPKRSKPGRKPKKG